MAGFKAGMTQAAYESKNSTLGNSVKKNPGTAQFLHFSDDFDRSADMQFIPNDISHPVSVMNEVTGKPTHVWLARAQVSYGDTEQPMTVIKSLILEIPAMVAFVWAFVLAFMLIYHINKSNNVFCWENVRRLRWIGVLMLIYSILTTVNQIIDASIAAGQVSFKGYSFDYSSCIEFSSILLGIVTLIVAEIFAVGLKLQEEQELTI